MVTTFVTVFDYEWNLVGGTTIDVREDQVDDPIYRDSLCKLAIAKAGIAMPDHVHVTMTQGRAPTTEEAKARWRSRDPDVETWVF